ncbi:hypothetical protein [Bacterioplanoides sp. SCSIO 12839]|uniref:hypothetical protein n=1 Tax=Bacterioplanoides sp. SCSIO 12839 TaxID=2829569 RepID=UPI002106F3CE|nr:hypothetical protein [Bacterioplanoides sp. SCSIO 12839]UTW47476.1 hypothetical protein KFF03_12950 [Bacterioplanoides sp. SCSIO 12839]
MHIENAEVDGLSEPLLLEEELSSEPQATKKPPAIIKTADLSALKMVMIFSPMAYAW